MKSAAWKIILAYSPENHEISLNIMEFDKEELGEIHSDDFEALRQLFQSYKFVETLGFHKTILGQQNKQ